MFEDYIGNWVESMIYHKDLTEAIAIMDLITILEVGFDGFDFSFEYACAVASAIFNKPISYFEGLAMLGKAASEVYGEV